MEWYYYLIAFISFWLIRGIVYWSKYWQISKARDQYYLYLAKSDKHKLFQRKSQIISLFKEAGVKNFSIPHYEMLTGLQGYRHSLDGFDNLHMNTEEVVITVNMKFEEAIGVFRRNAIQSFNPLFWLEFILKLPEQIFSYLNFDIAGSIMKIIQLIYWVVMMIIGLHAGKVIDITSWF